MDEISQAADLWFPFDAGRTIGQGGGEDGLILRDEAHARGARITLESEPVLVPYVVTVQVYGFMAHARYFMTEEEAQSAFDEMKPEVDRIVRLIPEDDDPDEEARTRALLEALEGFPRQFPSRPWEKGE